MVTECVLLLLSNLEQFAQNLQDGGTILVSRPPLMKSRVSIRRWLIMREGAHVSPPSGFELSSPKEHIIFIYVGVLVYSLVVELL